MASLQTLERRILALEALRQKSKAATEIRFTSFTAPALNQISGWLK
jgi:hypothetical protein